MQNSEKFEASLNLDMLSVEDIEIQRRRLAVYSIEALKAAIVVDKIHLAHPDFKNALYAFDRVFQLAPEMDMAQGMLLLGPTGVGKTAVFKYFRDSLPSSTLFAQDYGVLGLRCPRRPTLGFLISTLLRAYKYPFYSGTEKQLYSRRDTLLQVIKEKKTRLLFFDEATGLLNAITKLTTLNGESDVSDFFRELIDQCRVGLVFAANTNATSLEDLDEALASRITVRQAMREFKADAGWLGVLSAFAKQCNSYDVSFIENPSIANSLHKVTHGNLRILKRLIIEAVLIGVDSGKQTLNHEILAKAFDLNFGNSSGVTNAFK